MVEELLKKLEIKINDVVLMREALTHRSYLNENRDYKLNHNERLEFLGDAVLELVVTEYLFKNYSNPEGELTSWRASLVNGDMLASVAIKLKLEDYLLMSRGEARDKGSRARRYILANAMEAMIGAIYLDQGYEMAQKFITDNIICNLQEVLDKKLFLDPKSRFQEASQEKMNITPNYKVLKEFGPDHDRRFTVGAFIKDDLISEGTGASKQEAQRDAAINAIEKLNW